MAAGARSRIDTAGSRPWLIGGPARCGKSSLARAVAASRSGPAVLQVDALFPAYCSRRPPLLPEGRRRLLRDYLLRARYVDAARTQTARPMDAFKASIDEIVGISLNAIPSGHHITLFAKALDQLAIEQGRVTWLAVDLHPELQYRRLVRLVPGLRLVVMLRDPREAIAASLYWRTFPDRLEKSERHVRYRLLLWLLSAQTGHALATKYPDSAFVCNFHTLLAGEGAPPAVALGLNGQDFLGAFEGLPLFSFRSRQGFLCPDGRWHQLLTADEIGMIETTASPWMEMLGLPLSTALPEKRTVSLRYRLFVRALLEIGRLNPVAAKSLSEFLLLPGAWCTRRIALAKQSLRGRIDGLRLASKLRADRK